MNDPVVDQIRKVREEYAARFNYDIAAICKDLREQGKAGGYTFVSLPPKRVESKNR